MQLFTSPNCESVCVEVSDTFLEKGNKSIFYQAPYFFLMSLTGQSSKALSKSNAHCLGLCCITQGCLYTICSESQAKRKAMNSTIIMEEAEKVMASRHSHCKCICCLCLFQALVTCQQSIYYIIMLLPEASSAIKLDCQTHWIFTMPDPEDDSHLAPH